MLQDDTVLFPVRRAHWYVPKRPLGCSKEGCKGSQGDDFYNAPNPPFGATFTYYLPQPIRSSKDARREVEKEKEKQNESVEFPTWDRILGELREDPSGTQQAMSFATSRHRSKPVFTASAGTCAIRPWRRGYRRSSAKNVGYRRLACSLLPAPSVSPCKSVSTAFWRISVSHKTSR
jgi:hypothetical protein